MLRVGRNGVVALESNLSEGYDVRRGFDMSEEGYDMFVVFNEPDAERVALVGAEEVGSVGLGDVEVL
jgi:hypothetical protein